jgi:hypothetical protein
MRLQSRSDLNSWCRSWTSTCAGLLLRQKPRHLGEGHRAGLRDDPPVSASTPSWEAGTDADRRVRNSSFLGVRAEGWPELARAGA